MERKYRIKTVVGNPRNKHYIPNEYNEKGLKYQLQERCRFGLNLILFIIPYWAWETIKQSAHKKELCDYADEMNYQLI
ncbi:hypothetical protein KA478_04595 [Patescibacteria group bacterium]|nr:hypothetical protein [Patescibacteria group bacterium]